MATANSGTNLIVFTAASDTARTTQRLRVAGVIAVATSLTAAATIKLVNGASNLQIIPLTKAKSGAGVFCQLLFRPAIEVTGLKATNCTNANIRVQLA